MQAGPGKVKSAVIVLLIGISISACFEPDPKVWKLDQEYGVAGFRLGDVLYPQVVEHAQGRSQAYDVVEYESFGSRFADHQRLERDTEDLIYGASVGNIYAGTIDQQIYALLFQIEEDEKGQQALVDSLTLYYGTPYTSLDTSYVSGGMAIQVNTRSWVADSVGLELGIGEGYAELLIFDRQLREKREAIQRNTIRSQRKKNQKLDAMSEIGEVNLDEIASRARWKYKYRGEEKQVNGGSYGSIDYSYVKPFFEVEGKSFYGVKIAYVNLSFMPVSDSLKTIQVRFENTQGQMVGFMDMLRVMERKLGRHAYSDTLHTPKGPFRRASWYGDELTIVLEENRFRPESPDLADVVVNFTMDRVQMAPREPIVSTDNKPATVAVQPAEDSTNENTTDDSTAGNERK